MTSVSKHDGELFSELLDAQRKSQPVALATVVKARGSVPRHAGSKMLIYSDGQTSGTIGGGEMEARVIQEAKQAIKLGKPTTVPYSLVDPSKGDPGVCGGEVEVFIEPYLSPATILVIGCGHVGRAVVHIASWLGYYVVACDDREELVDPQLVPGADLYLPGSVDLMLKQFSVTSNTYIVTVTRNVLVDREILPKLAETPTPYIGVIGSRRRWEETKRLLKQDGLDDKKMQRFHSPIGLEINAETPEEIAVSILAEVIMLRQGGTGERMKT